ncbi:hypothetical protein L0222_31820 [bacterium]|nr:hypothetical protein [bacterium]MCI0603006.1 hypothetical protein [bacterium]
MSLNVFLAAKTIHYPQGGGHLWVYLNWALSLKAEGCNVYWLETVKPGAPPERVESLFESLKSRLAPFGFGEKVFVIADHDESASLSDGPDPKDLIIDINYKVPSNVIGEFRKSVLVDIDPGLNQMWLSRGRMHFSPHDFYFTIGETVGKPDAIFPDGGLRWHYTPPPVYLPAWPVAAADSSAPYTTVTHWWGDLMEVNGTSFYNGKRTGFYPYLELPRHTSQPLELAIFLTTKEADEKDRIAFSKNGWRIVNSHEVSSTPENYARYIQNSRGEFSCVKPSCIHLQNAWISDRTICYLASGKPAIIEHTGPSSFLPDAEGLFRFRNLIEAAQALETASADYNSQSRLARALAEEYFDGRKIVRRMLETVL